jgi:hypothetical protein
MFSEAEDRTRAILTKLETMNQTERKEGPMRIKKENVCAALVGVALLGVIGCSSTGGGFMTHTTHAYPNSNIKPMGPTSADWSRFMVFMPASPNVDDLRKVYNDALAKVPGANIMIDFREDTTITIIPPLFYITKYRIEGEAAKMEVGKQELR